MRWLGAICVALSMSAICFAEPPTIDIRSEIEAKGDVVNFTPKTDAKTVIYIGLSGVDPLPPEILKDPRTFVLYTRGLKAGYYKFIAIAVKDNEVTRQDFIIRKGTPPPAPQPEPVPPEPEPEPTPSPLDDAPVSTNGIYVAFINETGNRVTQPQFNVMYGATSTKWLDANCVSINSNPQWRIIDQNNVALSEPWKDILKRKRETIPWVVIISNKKYVYEGPLSPTVTANAFIELVSKYKPVAKRAKAEAPAVVPEVATTTVPFSQESTPSSLRDYRTSLVREVTGLTTIALTADDWKQQFQYSEQEKPTTTIAPIETVETATETILTSGTKTYKSIYPKVDGTIGSQVDWVERNGTFYMYGQSSGCVGGNCPAPQYQKSSSWYPGKILGR